MDGREYQREGRGVCKDCVNTLGTVINTETLQVLHLGFIILLMFQCTSIITTKNKDEN